MHLAITMLHLEAKQKQNGSIQNGIQYIVNKQRMGSEASKDVSFLDGKSD